MHGGCLEVEGARGPRMRWGDRVQRIPLFSSCAAEVPHWGGKCRAQWGQRRGQGQWRTSW